jgi:hypothetical protein
LCGTKPVVRHKIDRCSTQKSDTQTRPKVGQKLTGIS